MPRASDFYRYILFSDALYRTLFYKLSMPSLKNNLYKVLRASDFESHIYWGDSVYNLFKYLFPLTKNLFMQILRLPRPVLGSMPLFIFFRSLDSKTGSGKTYYYYFYCSVLLFVAQSIPVPRAQGVLVIFLNHEVYDFALYVDDFSGFLTW